MFAKAPDSVDQATEPLVDGTTKPQAETAKAQVKTTAKAQVKTTDKAQVEIAEPARSQLERPPVSHTLAARVRPISSTKDRLLPLTPPLSPLFPDGALRRGTTVLVTGEPGHGGTTLAFALLAAASASGSWSAAVGLTDPGIVALAELGLDLERVVFVPAPGNGWADTAAALVDGLDMVLVRPPARAQMTAARHLVARTRDRQAVLVVLARRAQGWPEPSDVHLELDETAWWGMERGHVPLQARHAEVRSSGRRAAWRPVRRTYWLPGSDGRLAVVEDQPAYRRPADKKR